MIEMVFYRSVGVAPLSALIYGISKTEGNFC